MGLDSDQRRRLVLTIYLIVVASILLMDQVAAPDRETVANALIFISDTDAIDAGRQSNSVYRIGLDGSGLKRIVGSIPHGDGYLRISDIDCEGDSQQLVIASHWRDLNGFHHALLDGSGLHWDKPKNGAALLLTRQIAIAPDGKGILISRQFDEFRAPRFGLVGGDLFTRHYHIVKPATAALSYYSPVWSPSGKRIAYIIERHDGETAKTYQLAVARSTGADEFIVYESSLMISDLDWSPAGNWIALSTSGRIYKLRLDGSGLTLLSSHHVGASSPRWSPDGERISFVAPSSFMGFKQLLVMDKDGGEIVQVANIRGDVTNGCWV